MANPSDTAIRDHANVRIPPPLIYVAGFVIGLLIEIEFPILLLPVTARRVAAILCIAVSAILIVWSIRLFRRAGTSFIPIKPTTALVWSGPYQFTRNPMYLAMDLPVPRVGALVRLVLAVDSVAWSVGGGSIWRDRARGAIFGAKVWR